MSKKKPSFRVKHPYQNLINSMLMGMVLLLSSILSVFLIKPELSTISFVDAYGGNGSEERPYLIYNVNDLKNVESFTVRAINAKMKPRHFKLMADVDATTLNRVVSKNFVGSFDGNNMSIITSEPLFDTIAEQSEISDLYIDATTQIDENKGYLSTINFGYINNVSLISTKFSSKSFESYKIESKINQLNDEIEQIKIQNGYVLAGENDSNSNETISVNSLITNSISSSQDSNNINLNYDNFLIPDIIRNTGKPISYFLNLTEDDVYNSKLELVNNPNLLVSSNQNVHCLNDSTDNVYIISENRVASLSLLKYELIEENYLKTIEKYEKNFENLNSDEQILKNVLNTINYKNEYNEYFIDFTTVSEEDKQIYYSNADFLIEEKENKISELLDEQYKYSFNAPLVFYNGINGVISNSVVGQITKIDSEDTNIKNGVYSNNQGVYAKNQYATNTSFSGDGGGFVYANSGIIEKCANTNSTTKSTSTSSNVWVGGFAVYNYSGATIIDCYNESKVSDEKSSGGGKVGGFVYLNQGTIKRCINYGTVQGHSGKTGSTASSASGGAGGSGGRNGISWSGGYGGKYGYGGKAGGGGYAGTSAAGIAVSNSGTILNCFNFGQISSGSGGRGGTGTGGGGGGGVLQEDMEVIVVVELTILLHPVAAAVAAAAVEPAVVVAAAAMLKIFPEQEIIQKWVVLEQVAQMVTMDEMVLVEVLLALVALVALYQDIQVVMVVLQEQEQVDLLHKVMDHLVVVVPLVLAEWEIFIIMEVEVETVEQLGDMALVVLMKTLSQKTLIPKKNLIQHMILFLHGIWV